MSVMPGPAALGASLRSEAITFGGFPPATIKVSKAAS